MRSPSLKLERSIGGVVAGVDEAGCAPLAGPVVAAAVIFPSFERRPRTLRGLVDSKLLTREQREKLCSVILGLARVGVGAASAAEIDRLNIYQANMLAMRRAVAALRAAPDLVIVDGNRAPKLAFPVQTMVKGDQRCLSVAAASVVAKVTRDRLMTRLALRHPGYAWETNKGYPTDDHYLGLLRFGPTAHHRRTFAPLSTIFAPGQLPLRFSAKDPSDLLGGVHVLALREDLHSVCDGRNLLLGTLKRLRSRWVFRALGYDEGGNLVAGRGPLHAAHDREVATPDLRSLRRLLDSGV